MRTARAIKLRLAIYLFHGKAVKIRVLAINSEIRMAKGGDLVENLSDKAAAEALQHSNSLQNCGESIPISSVWVIFGD